METGSVVKQEVSLTMGRNGGLIKVLHMRAKQIHNEISGVGVTLTPFHNEIFER